MTKETTINVTIGQSVAILVDGNNIERSIHSLINNTNGMLNFDAVIPKILGNRTLNRFIYFREGKSISSKLQERLHTNYYGQVRPCHKSADIPLTIQAMQLASKVDTIVIMSGDSDYIELVRQLRSEGVRVEIASIIQNTAEVLLTETDFYHEITESDVFFLPEKKEKDHGRRRR